jgi:hypothetical protein
MLARQMVIAVRALLTVPSVHAQQAQSAWQPNPWRSLLVADRVSEDITGMNVTEIGLDGIPRYLSADFRVMSGLSGRWRE